MADIRFRDLTGQRETSVSADGHTTVGELLSDAVGGMRLPTQTSRGLALDYSVRTSGGHILRPSESLKDERIRGLLEEGENAAIPRLTAARPGP